jgi:hydrogenase maturation factor HypF (carbamoyltransferase family)
VKSRGESRSAKNKDKDEAPLQMFLVPCSCGTTFAVAHNYDRHGTSWSRYLICPGCGKRHDPRNRLLQVGYHREGYWQVDRC